MWADQKRDYQIFRRNLKQLRQHIKNTSEGRKIWEIEYRNGVLDGKFTGK